jgi:hypothetical protein
VRSGAVADKASVICFSNIAHRVGQYRAAKIDLRPLDTYDEVFCFSFVLMANTVHFYVDEN